jgi:hypothetical protein
VAYSVQLSWTPSPDTVDGYNVYRGTAAGQESPTPINAQLVTGTSYLDASVADGQSYAYRVTAVKSGLESARSNEVQVTVARAFGGAGLLSASAFARRFAKQPGTKPTFSFPTPWRKKRTFGNP